MHLQVTILLFCGPIFFVHMADDYSCMRVRVLTLVSEPSPEIRLVDLKFYRPPTCGRSSKSGADS